MQDQELIGSFIFFFISVSMLIYFYKRDKNRDPDSEESLYGMLFRIKPYGLFIVIALISLLGIIVKIIRIYQI